MRRRLDARVVEPDFVRVDSKNVQKQGLEERRGGQLAEEARPVDDKPAPTRAGAARAQLVRVAESLPLAVTGCYRFDCRTEEFCKLVWSLELGPR